jgi:metal-dependent amidase/aminoacylase/carboxypeptidase family protein
LQHAACVTPSPLSGLLVASCYHQQAMPTAAIPADVASCVPWMVELRRHFHATPELSFAEHETAARVAAELRALSPSLEVWEGVGRTGVVALLRGGGGAGPCVALRADMDALPLQETGSLPFMSRRAGVMHACGHDGHMAALLGAAPSSSSSSPPRRALAARAR